MTAMAMISILLFGFAPITLFFLLSGDNYPFFLLLNVGIMGLTGFLGIKFFYQGMQFLSQEDIEGKTIRFKILRFWLILYGFVGTQMGWTLRPFFGSPGLPFTLFRERESNFYLSILQAIKNVLGY
jgi:hypothetical protein